MENKLCCDVFPKLFNKINWFSYYSQGVQILNMPHFITNEGERLRINHCPSCGTDIRSIEIEEADYIELKKLAL
jgi:hypothetical protein